MPNFYSENVACRARSPQEALGFKATRKHRVQCERVHNHYTANSGHDQRIILCYALWLASKLDLRTNYSGESRRKESMPLFNYGTL